MDDTSFDTPPKIQYNMKHKHTLSTVSQIYVGGKEEEEKIALSCSFVPKFGDNPLVFNPALTMNGHPQLLVTQGILCNI